MAPVKSALDALHNFSKKIFQLNPRQVHNFKESYSDLPKTDPVDAFVIADCLRFGRIGAREAVMDPQQKALQRLTRSRFHVAQNLTREKNRYLSNLFLKFSAMAQERLFSDNFGSTAMALVEEYESIDDIAYRPVEELADFLNAHGKGKFADPDELAKTIQSAARASYRLPKTVIGSVNQVLAFSAQTIRFYQKQLADHDKVIEQLLAVFPNTLTSIKGIGPVYAAGIIAESGDISRFSNQAAFGKYAGLTWSRYQSGSFDADNTHMVNSGNKYLRYYLIEATNSVRKHDAELKSFYEMKYRETPKTPHKRALVLSARKFARLVYAILRDKKLYTPS